MDIGIAHKVISSIYRLAGHLTLDRIGTTSNIGNIIASFDNNDVKKYFFDFHGIRYPKDSLIINDGANEHLDQ